MGIRFPVINHENTVPEHEIFPAESFMSPILQAQVCTMVYQGAGEGLPITCPALIRTLDRQGPDVTELRDRTTMYPVLSRAMGWKLDMYDRQVFSVTGHRLSPAKNRG